MRRRFATGFPVQAPAPYCAVPEAEAITHVSDVQAGVLVEVEPGYCAVVEAEVVEEVPATAVVSTRRMCPVTKRLRDECVGQHGEVACAKWIRAHVLCMRAEGFLI